MAKHPLNPSEGEVWYHPLTRNEYRIHSITDDGWVRYFAEEYATYQDHQIYPFFTQPTLVFISKYTKAVQ